MLEKENKRKETSLTDETLSGLAEENGNNLIQPLWKLALEILNEKSYQAMRLHYAEDLSIREIAKIMGKTETGIKVILFRTDKNSVQQLRSEGISLKTILTILRNQPTDSSDLKLINTLRDEAKRERLNDSQKIDFKIKSINQERQIYSRNPNPERRPLN